MSSQETALDLVDARGPLARYAMTTPTSLTLVPDAPYDGWTALMDVLGQLGRGVIWWSGDALLHGETLYGEKYAQAMEHLHVDYKTLANRVWVSKKIPPQHRREDLAWTHHQVVAGLPTLKAMDSWLERAAREKWDSKTLAKEIRKASRTGSASDGASKDREPAPNVGLVVEAAVRKILRDRFSKIKRPGPWAAKILGTVKTRNEEVQRWAKAIRARVEHDLDA